MAVFFCSIAVAFAIGNYLDSYPYGFNCREFMFSLQSYCFFMRDKIVEGPILEKFSEIFLTTKLWSKIYSSYAQIDRQLEILKIEKEISYQKLVLVFKKTKTA
jgi:hypothetical protein